MAQSMFGTSFVDTKGTARKPLAFTASIVLEIFALSALMLLPLIFTERLPKTVFAAVLVAPPSPPPPPPPVVTTSPPRHKGPSKPTKVFRAPDLTNIAKTDQRNFKR